MIQLAKARRIRIEAVGIVLAALLGPLPEGAFAHSQAPVPPLAAAAAGPNLLTNERHPLPGMLTGGLLPDPAGESAAAQFQALADAGVRTLVDLRTEGEAPPGTAALAAAAGLDYRRLPVGGEVDLDLASVRALDKVLDDWARFPLAVACASGNRSGALLALRAFWLEAAPPEEALALGLRAGLTRLEPSVRMLLGLPPALLTLPAPQMPLTPSTPPN